MVRVTGILWVGLCQVPTLLAGQSGIGQAVDTEPVLQLGEVLGDSSEFSFSDITAIRVIGDSIFVLDGALNEIRIFDHGGEFLGRIGRRGEGPGEFMWPVAMRLVPEGLAVVDLKLRRQSFFTSEGELLRTEPLGHLGDQELSGSAVMRSGEAVAETAVSISSDRGAFPERLIVVTRPGSQRMDTVARYSTGYVPFRAPGSFGFLGPRAGSEGDWTVAGDSLLVVVSGEPSTVRWWRAGAKGLAPAGELELPLRPEAFTRDDARDFLEETNQERRAKEEALLPRSVEMDPPGYWGQVKQLVIRDDQECWIQWDRPRSALDDEWFRVDLNSGRLERTRLPDGFRMLAAVGGNLYGFVLAEYDAPRLTVLRLRGSNPE